MAARRARVRGRAGRDGAGAGRGGSHRRRRLAVRAGLAHRRRARAGGCRDHVALPRDRAVPLFGYPLPTLGAFLALALVPTVLGHGLVNRSLRRIPAPTVGLFLLGEPLGASALAYAVFGEVPGPLTLAGGVLVLAALVVVVRSEPA
ncbi:MAG: hypothetical protein DMF78_15355 [Acidobacteria bacterium]|nr:MAG: hypothetical protein DMF78_15355 [Acidobacteriota bacterium]